MWFILFHKQCCWRTPSPPRTLSWGVCHAFLSDEPKERLGVESGINGEEGACDRYYGVGLHNSCPIKLLA